MGSSRFVRGVAVTAVALVAVTSLALQRAPAAARESGPPELRKPDSHGITLVSWEQVDPGEPASVPRLIDATVTTDAIYEAGDSGKTPAIDDLSIPLKVRILLPANYRTDRAHRNPVLYLLHGGGGDYLGWSVDGKVEDIVADSSFDGIVVMPEGGWPAGTPTGRARS